MIEQAIQSYRVVRGSLQIPRKGSARQFVNRSDFIMQGEIVPAGLFCEADLAGWLADGRICLVIEDQDGTEAREKNRRRGKWMVDPASLYGKTMEDLLLLVIDIDPEYDTDNLNDESDVVRLLTKDWDPVFAESVACAADRNSIVALKHDGVRDAGERAMSAQAQAMLERAKHQAQTKAAETAPE